MLFLGFLCVVYVFYEFEDSVGDVFDKVRESIFHLFTFFISCFFRGQWVQCYTGVMGARRRGLLSIIELVIGLFLVVLVIVDEPGDPILFFHHIVAMLNMRAMVAAAAPERKAATASPTTTT